MVQKLDAFKVGRPETGAMQFGDDWKGLFVRGDDCIMLMNLLKQCTYPTVIHEGVAKSFINVIEEEVLK